VTAAGTEAVVRAYVDACNGSDLEAVLAMLDPDVELHESTALPGAVSAVGFDAVRHYLDRFYTHWSSFRWEPLELEIHGDQAAMRARLRLTGRESGIEVDREWWYVFAVRDGKLMTQHGFDDREAALATLSPACRR
jgi:ketosteroid isomerase-like protein